MIEKSQNGRKNITTDTVNNNAIFKHFQPVRIYRQTEAGAGGDSLNAEPK